MEQNSEDSSGNSEVQKSTLQARESVTVLRNINSNI